MKKFAIFVAVVVVLFGAFVWFLTDVPGSRPVGALPMLTSAEEELREDLKAHVLALSRDIGIRGNADSSKLVQAIEYVEDRLRRSGLEIRREPFQAAGRSSVNLIADLKGTTKPKEVVLVGAHLDSPRGSPGADCDASGVAGVIELAERLASSGSDRTLRFAFFTFSESPFAGTPGQGAYQHAEKYAERQERITAAVLLEGIGNFSDKPGSQSVPFPYTLSFPDRGDFIAILGGFSSRDLLARTVSGFRSASRMPSEGCTVPPVFPGFSGTDAAAISKAGFPAVLVTDTGSLRSEVYGTASDTHDRLDYDRMARVVQGLDGAIRGLMRAPSGAP